MVFEFKGNKAVIFTGFLLSCVFYENCLYLMRRALNRAVCFFCIFWIIEQKYLLIIIIIIIIIVVLVDDIGGRSAII